MLRILVINKVPSCRQASNFFLKTSYAYASNTNIHIYIYIFVSLSNVHLVFNLVRQNIHG